ncbi:MAG: thiol protease/hemagglutinin PrtT [Paludibacteraceae bacterium]|nr:thiol protease/hemagglutinin PrtT [Paludibacteraceae bacterium]
MKDIAYSFFMTSNDSSRVSSPEYRNNIQVEDIKRGNSTYLFIANMPNKGWAIVSNEQRYPTIIGYSEESHFDTDLNHHPGALKLLLEHHMNMIDSLRESPSTFYDRVPSRSPISHVPVRIGADSVLLKRNGHPNCWGQFLNNSASPYDCDKVYNKYCPEWFICDTVCNKTVVGCTAVAIAQLAWYWRWPDYAYIRDSIGLLGEWYGQSRRHYYDWNNMPTSIYSTTPLYQIDMVAGLLRDCGYASHMIYSIDGSAAGTGYLQSALEDTYLFHTHRDYEYAWTDIAPILIDEISVNRPVICQAWDYEEGELGAHTFVIDGYSAQTNKFHLNLGWGGSEYSVTNSMWDLGFYGYTINRTFFTEIYPNCTAREASVSGIENRIEDGQNVTLYSANNVSLGQLVVESGGRLNVSVGGCITLNSGFCAELGSMVELASNYTCVQGVSSAPVCLPQREYEEPINYTKSNNLYVVYEQSNNDIIIHSDVPLVQIALYDVNGKLLLLTSQKQIDLYSLPRGIYVIRAITEDGGMVQSKLIH